MDDLDTVKKEIEEIREKLSKITKDDVREQREQRVFRIVFGLYLLPVISTIFIVLALKHTENWVEMAISGGYMILVVFLLLDSGFGKQLMKWTGIYYYFYQYEEVDWKTRIGFAVIAIGYIPAFIFTEKYFSQYEEIFHFH